MKGKSSRVIIFLLFLVFGLYFVNLPFNFVKLPQMSANVNVWITFIGGILIIFGGISYLRASKYSV